jgi:C4-dicarboxylate-specific signal transduction histidine kinase
MVDGKPDKTPLTGAAPPSRTKIFVVIYLVLGLSAIWVASNWTQQTAINNLREIGAQRLTLYAGSLRGALRRFDYLPYVMAQKEIIKSLILSQDAPGQKRAANILLEKIISEANAEALYVMDANGNTLAASNWRMPFSFVGKNYGFRSYFKTAMDGNKGRHFAIGATTNIPGYFFSSPVFHDGTVIGVVVAKVNLDHLQEEWKLGGEVVMASDENGVVILTSNKDWRFRTFRAFDSETKKQVTESRKYNQTIPSLMPGAKFTPLGKNVSHLVLSPQKGRDRSDKGIGKQGYLFQSLPLAELGWDIRYLSDYAIIDEQIRVTVIYGIAVLLVILLTALYIRARIQTRRARRLTRAELQQKVEERTLELREAQEELVQTGKLAALGQMSAAIAHELNQPLTAIKTFIASSQILMERGDTETTRDNLDQIRHMTDRMGQITDHLKEFARKRPKTPEPTSVAEAVDHALLLLESRIRLDEIELSYEKPEQDICILGDTVRLEQVLINLLRNAMDAMSGSTKKILRLKIETAEFDKAKITIKDTGTGIDEADIHQLFDPFFTTKDVGKGLGLGLSLSYGIIKDFGGTMRVTNNKEGGARFEILLPLTTRKETLNTKVTE